MHKYTVLFIVLCAVIVASAEPAKRKTVARKSAKIIRPAAIKAVKAAKLSRQPVKARRSGKMTAHAQGSAKVHFDHEQQPHHHEFRHVEVETPFHHHVETPFHHDEVHHAPHHQVHHHEVFQDFEPAVEDEIVPEIIIADEEFEQDFPVHHHHHHHETPVEDEVEFTEVEEPVFVEDEVVVVKEAPKAVESGTRYFNTHFGTTKDGSIALANSYSTGQKGAATSHATSHGTKAH